MPSFAHWFFAIGLAIFLWKLTEGKFGIKPALIFMVNNVFGPDLMGIFLAYNDPWYYFFHGMGWYLMALLTAVLWFFLINAQVDRNQPGSTVFAKLQLLPKDQQLKYWQIYLFCAAGGMTHLFIDLIGHPSYIDAGTIGSNIPWGVVWFGDSWYLSQNSILASGLFPCGQLYLPVVFLTIGYVIGIVASIIWGMKTRNFWNLVKGLLVVVLSVFVIYIITFFIPIPDSAAYFNDKFYNDFTYYGNPNNVPVLIWFTGGEADFGVMIYLGLFFFLPLLLLYYGFKDLPKLDNPPTQTVEKTPRKPEVAPYLK